MFREVHSAHLSAAMEKFRDLRTEQPNFAFEDPRYRTKGPKVSVPLPFRLDVLNNTKAQLNVSPISKAKLMTKHHRAKSAREQITSDLGGRAARCAAGSGASHRLSTAGAKARALVARRRNPNCRLRIIYK